MMTTAPRGPEDSLATRRGAAKVVVWSLIRAVRDPPEMTVVLPSRTRRMSCEGTGTAAWSCAATNPARNTATCGMRDRAIRRFMRHLRKGARPLAYNRDDGRTTGDHR